jgi:hypothetical protein
VSSTEPGHRPPTRNDFGLGVFIGVFLTLAAGLMLFLSLNVGSGLGTMAFACFGLAQLVYMVPAMILAKRKGRPLILRGILLITALAFLLNAGCWGLVAFDLGSFH